jgi:hypothetical protein
VGVSSSAMFETVGDLLSLSSLVIQQHRPRDVREFVICNTMSITILMAEVRARRLDLPSRTPSPILILV